MAEVEMLTEFTDQKMLTHHGEQSDFRLPRIDHPLSRGNVRSKAEKRITPTFLPVLRKQANSNKFEAGRFSSPKKNAAGDPESDDFVMNIEEKLKHVLQQVNKGENIQQDAQDNEEVDFQELIHQNKEIIKLQKQRNQSKNQQGNEDLEGLGRKASKNKTKTLKTVEKVDSANDRLKGLRDMSGDKYAQKKKEIMALKSETLDKAKAIAKQREELQRNSKPAAHLPPKYVSKPNKSRKQSPTQKPSLTHEKNSNLFDNIHNLLLHPHRQKQQNLMRRGSVGSIKQLQHKIRLINSRLGVQERQYTKETEDMPNACRTVSEWKRLEYNKGSSNFKFNYDSSFEKELQRIATMQEKNQTILHDYMDHQKMLLELAILKKRQQQKGEYKTS